MAEWLNAAASKVVFRHPPERGFEPLPLREMYFIYVLRSKVDKYHYIGHTSNLESRLAIHSRGKVKSTKNHCPMILIYSEIFEMRSEAQKREYYQKRGVGNFVE